MPCDSYPEFNLDEVNEEECLAEYQFKKVDIPLLAKALQIPPVFECPQGSVSVSDMDRLHLFAKPVLVLSLITNQVFYFIYDTHGHWILQWN